VRLGVEAALADGRLVPGDVEVAGGVVRALGVGAGGRGRGIAVPGLVDLQVNGIGDVDLLGAGAEELDRAGAALLAAGVTAVQPTFVSAPEADVAAALSRLGTRPAGRGGPRLIGAHLEGPFLSPLRPGAHDPAHLRAPELALLRRLLDAGPVRQVTLAPELPGAFELIDLLLGRGIVVSAGHSDASAAEAHLAFDRGVRTVTHLFNAMRPLVPRDPGIALAALARSDVSIQIIADGHHVAGDTLLVAWRAARGRIALVTDAVAATAMGDGDFALAGRPLVSAEGVVRGPEGQLAGSVLTMIDAVRNLHALGVPLAEALAAAAAVPASIVRRPDLGRLAPGAPADVVVLDDNLEIVRVLVGGGEGVAR